MMDDPNRLGREPMFNMPASVTVLIAAMAAIHVVRVFLLSPGEDTQVILLFSFIPFRYTAEAQAAGFPGGLFAEIWSPVTHGLLHGSATHILFNSVWLAAFGSALARRFGTVRFLAFTALATAAGAAAHYIAHPDEMIPVIGASAAISGHMAAVSRFMFQLGGPLRANRRDARIWRAEAVSLAGIVADRRVLGFLAVWFGLNLVFGTGLLDFTGEGGSIAWEAHIGGFLFGLLAFSLFDPPAPERERRSITRVTDRNVT